MFKEQLKTKSEQVNPSILENLPNQILLSKKLGNVYENRPEIDSFVGAMSDNINFSKDYTKEEIAKDQAYVSKVQSGIDESNSSFGQSNLDLQENRFQLSEIMQAMVVDRLNKNWFKGCSAIMTSEFDDLRSGVDAVMKHEHGGYLGLSFDFTVTSKDTIVNDKLNKEWDRNIKDGKVQTIKYFEDPDTKKKGRLMVPKFIVGASKRDVEELAEAYLSDDHETLRNHPFKYIMVLQIEEQLQMIIEYYNNNPEKSKNFSFAKDKYERIQKILSSIKEEIHLQEELHNRIDIYERSKDSVALDMIRRFRIMKDAKKPTV